jgi:starvation-inducible DNA-binding protein
LPLLPDGAENEVHPTGAAWWGAHKIILLEVCTAAQSGDDGTNDLLVSQVIRTNELQVWFLARHLVGVPREQADQTGTAQKSAGMRVIATSGRSATEN